MRKTTLLAIAASRKKKEIKMNPMILAALILTAAIAQASASNTEDAHMYCIEAQDGATNIAEATNGPEVWPLWSAFSKEQCQQIAAGIMPDGLAELVQRAEQSEAELRAEELRDQVGSAGRIGYFCPLSVSISFFMENGLFSGERVDRFAPWLIPSISTAAAKARWLPVRCFSSKKMLGSKTCSGRWNTSLCLANTISMIKRPS